MEFTAIDFETANESRASACAIGIVVVRNLEVVEEFYHLIRPPDLYFSPFNIRIHGIRPRDVLDQPSFAELWTDIRGYFENRLVIAHNASFDMSVLRSVLDTYNLDYPGLKYSCTMRMARRIWPYQPSYRLSSIAQMLGITFRHHHALEDAYACAQIATHMANRVRAASLRELVSRLGLSFESLLPASY